MTLKARVAFKRGVQSAGRVDSMMAAPEGECPVMWWVRPGRLGEIWVGFWGRVVDILVVVVVVCLSLG